MSISRQRKAANRERKREYDLVYRATNRERLRAYQKAYHTTNRERIRADARERRKNETPEQRMKRKARLTANSLKFHYGLTPKDVAAMVVAQSGLCAICKVHMKPPCVDHDHTTARVRALLCRQCNAGLGSFKESMSRLFAASEYLRYWKIRYEN